MSLELARAGTDLACVVGFHSGLATGTPAAAGEITATVLVHIGSEDPLIPPDQRTAFEQEMRAAGADWRMVLYGGAVHSFTNPAADGSNPAIAYDAARRRPLLAGDARPLRRGLLNQPACRVRVPRVGIRDHRRDLGRQLAARQVGDGDVLEHAAQRGPHRDPQRDERLLLAGVGELVGSDAAHRGQRSFEGADDVGDGDRRRVAREHPAPVPAAVALEDQPVAQAPAGCRRGSPAAGRPSRPARRGSRACRARPRPCAPTSS